MEDRKTDFANELKFSSLDLQHDKGEMVAPEWEWFLRIRAVLRGRNILATQ